MRKGWGSGDCGEVTEVRPAVTASVIGPVASTTRTTMARRYRKPVKPAGVLAGDEGSGDEGSRVTTIRA